MTRALITVFLASVLVVTSCAGPSRRAEMKMPYDDRLQLASIYIQSGKADQAMSLLEAAAIEYPLRPEAHAMMGEILFLRGDMDASARSLTLALEAGGEDPLILNNLAWVEMGRGDADRALNLTDRALGLNPAPLYPYLDTRARVLRELGRYEEALGDARTALKLIPSHETEMGDRLKELVKDLESAVPAGGEGYY